MSSAGSPLTPAQLRTLFPITGKLASLNAAGFAPLSTPVYEAAEGHLREQREEGDAHFMEWLARREEVRADYARLINASPRELAFLHSTSAGIHAAGTLLWQLGVREVLTLEHEFPSTTLPLLNLGFKLRVVRPDAQNRYPVELLERALAPTTRALVASAVQYATGTRLDLAGAGALCRAKNLFFLVNGSQAVGQVPVDVAQGIDLLCATSYKWTLGGFGVGFFYARDALFGSVRAPMAGWLSTQAPMALDNLAGAKVSGREAGAAVYTAEGMATRPEVSALEVGVDGNAALFGAGAAIQLLHRVGIRAIEAHNFALQQRLRERLASLGFAPLAPCAPGQGSGICTFRVEGALPAVVAALKGEGVVVSARGGGLRVSTHAYNDEEDLERLLFALARLAVRPASP